MNETAAQDQDSYRLRILFSLAVFLISFFCLQLNLFPSVYWLDSGELQASLPELGIPHSPSFPTYMLTNHPSRYLAFGDIAFRANVFTAGAGAMIGVLVFWILILLIRDLSIWEYWLCSAIGLTAVFNPLIWFQNLKAEIYS